MAVSSGEGTFTVDFETMRGLLAKSGVTIPETTAIVFGAGTFDEKGELHIAFAWDSEAGCYPSEWAVKPLWMK